MVATVLIGCNELVAHVGRVALEFLCEIVGQHNGCISPPVQHKRQSVATRIGCCSVRNLEQSLCSELVAPCIHVGIVGVVNKIVQSRRLQVVDEHVGSAERFLVHSAIQIGAGEQCACCIGIEMSVVA